MKPRNSASLLVVTAVSVCALPAGASDFEPHPYVLASAGNADTSARFTLTDEIDGDDGAFEIGAGYAFSRHFAVEASYQDFGEPDGFAGCPPDVLCIALVPFTRESVSVDGWTVALRGEAPVNKRFALFARLGFLAWDTSARTPGLNDSGTDLLYAAGASAPLNDRFSVQLSYEKADLDIEGFKAGVRMRF